MRVSVARIVASTFASYRVHIANLGRTKNEAHAARQQTFLRDWLRFRLRRAIKKKSAVSGAKNGVTTHDNVDAASTAETTETMTTGDP